MSQAEQVAQNMKNGYNCAQSIVKAYAKEVGIENEEEVVRMAAAFGAGIGRNGYVCGAITGAALIIGKKYGNNEPVDTARREKAYEVINKLVEIFEQEYRTVMCKDLISIDMKNPEELKKTRENGVFQNQCPAFVLLSGRALDELLQS